MLSGTTSFFTNMCIVQCLCSSLVFVLHFLGLILNFTAIINFIKAPLRDCEISDFVLMANAYGQYSNDSGKRYLALIAS